MLTIFHNPSLKDSKEALRLLKRAATIHKFQVDLIQDKYNPPTPSQIEYMIKFLGQGDIPRGCDFILKEEATATLKTNQTPKPTTVEEVQKLLRDNPEFLKKPIIVDWNKGFAIVADVSFISFYYF